MTSDVAYNSDVLLDQLRSATIGRYDIYAELGRGGMAAVFLGLDLALDRKVAIKVMLPEIMQGPGTIDRFRREARLAAALSHPHIVPVYSVGDSPNLAYFVMKYIDGRSLDSVLRGEGRQSPVFVQAVLQQVGSALDHAHKRNIIHRDVKPANIMLDEGGWVMLTDFGIAKLEDDYALTSSGMIIGTPSYMSPEHFTGMGVGYSSDQYALGVVGYELLTGRPPFVRNTVAELMKSHIMDVPVPVHEVVPRCPRSLCDCIMRMLAKTPDERFPSLADAIGAINLISPELQHAVSSQITALARINADQRPRISVPISPSPMPSLAKIRQQGAPPDPVASVEVPTNVNAVSVMPTSRRWMIITAAGMLLTSVAVGATMLWQTGSSGGGSGAPLQPADSANHLLNESPSGGETRRNALKLANVSPNPDRRPAAPPSASKPQSATARGAPPETRKELPAERSTPAAVNPPNVPPVAPVDSAKSTPPETTAAVPVVSGPPEPQRGWLRIGSRDPDAVLTIDGGSMLRLGEQLRVFQTGTGSITIRVVKDGCAAKYENTVRIAHNDTVNVGRIALNCNNIPSPSHES